MDPSRPVQRSYYNYWGEGQGHADIFVYTASTAVDAQRVGRVHVVLHQMNRSLLIGAPLHMENERFLTPTIHESWIEDIPALFSFEQTVAGQAITAYIRSVPYLRDFVQDYFINIIASEARDTAETAASLQHRSAWLIIDLNISIHLGYDGPRDGNHHYGGVPNVDEADNYGGDALVWHADVDPLLLEQMAADMDMQQFDGPEGVVGDADMVPAPPEGVVGDAVEMEGGGIGNIVPEGVVGDAVEMEGGGIGNIVPEGVVGDPPGVLVGDPPGDPEEFADLESLLTRLLGQPVGPFLEAVGLTRGLSPAAIQYHLTVATYMGASPETCSICLENIENGTQGGWLPCSHSFHPACIARWLQRSAVCPICRFKLSNNIVN